MKQNKPWQNTLDKDLVFEEARHRYTYKGEYVPGVTTVINDQVPKPALINWAVKMMAEYLDENLPCGVAISPNEKAALLQAGKQAHVRVKEDAAAAGKLAHAWVENHIKGVAQDMPGDPLVLNAVNAFMEWEEAHHVKYTASERKLYSAAWGVAGTADAIAEVDGKMCLLDLKTGNGIWPEHYIQTAAYARMTEEDNIASIEEIWIIRLGKDDGKFYAHSFEGGVRDAYQRRFSLVVEGYFLDRQIKSLEKNI